MLLSVPGGINGIWPIRMMLVWPSVVCGLVSLNSPGSGGGRNDQNKLDVVSSSRESSPRIFAKSSYGPSGSSASWSALPDLLRKSPNGLHFVPLDAKASSWKGRSRASFILPVGSKAALATRGFAPIVHQEGRVLGYACGPHQVPFDPQFPHPDDRESVTDTLSK